MLADSFERLPFGDPESSNPWLFQEAGDQLLFSAGWDNRQVWRTDGTAEGTQRASGLPGDSFPLGEVGGRALYGTWNSQFQQSSLWATDGTSEGTTHLMGSYESVGSGASLGDRFVVGGGGQLTVTDGLTAFDTINVPATHTHSFTEAGDYVYFVCAVDPLLGRNSLWRTRGTSESTEQVEFPEFAHNPSSLTAVGSDLYAVLYDSAGMSLWKMGRSAPAPTRVTTLSMDEWQLVGLDDALLLWQGSTSQLHRTNGSGLEMIADFDRGRIIASNVGEPIEAAVYRGGLYFMAERDGTDANLWTTDGTINGTKPLAVVPASEGWFTQVHDSQVLPFGLALAVDQGSSYAVWITQGDASNTRELLGRTGTELGMLGERLYFSATDRAGAELWTYDGTQAAPTRLVDLAPETRNFWAGGPMAWGDRTLVYHASSQFVFDPRTDRIQEVPWHGGYFVADPAPDRAFSVSHPIDAGTGDIWMLRADTLQLEHVVTRPEPVLDRATVGPRLIFAQSDGYWSTDGTPAGTQRFFASNISAPRLFDTGDLAYFAIGHEVYQTEGTATSTQRVAVVPEGEEVRQVSRRADGSLFLVSSNTAPERFFRLRFVQPGSQEAGLLWTGDSFPGIDALGSTGLFTNAVGNTDELWMSDGTASGTRLLSDRFSGSIRQILAAGNKAFLITDRPDVWSVNLNGSGLTQLPLSLIWSNQVGAVLDGRLYVTADDGRGASLWRSDGTAAGTERLSDRIFYDHTPTAIGRSVYASTDYEGGEAWRYTPGYGSPRLRENPVTLSGGGASYTVPTGSGEQLRSVPLSSIDQVSLHFDEGVIVKRTDLTIRGQRSGLLGTSAFSFDANTNTATWTLAQPLRTADRFTLTLDDAVHDPNGTRLDGEWTNPTRLDERTEIFRSGDLVEGGDFAFDFVLTPGDANRDNQVSSADFQVWGERFGALTKGGIPAADFNLDGVVSGLDFSIWAEFFGSVVSTAVAPSAGGPQAPPASEAPRGGVPSQAQALAARDWVLSESFAEALDGQPATRSRRGDPAQPRPSPFFSVPPR